MIARVILIGFSGTGKSTVGQLLAERLGWAGLDMDAEIEQTAGMAIPEMFDTQGESAFRSLERTVLLEALDRKNVVVATGGGAVCTDDIWTRLQADPMTLVVRLDASPEEILRRLELHRAQVTDGRTTRRPMLDADDPLGRIVELLLEREQYYARASVTLPVNGQSPQRITDDLAELVLLGNGSPSEVMLNVPNAQSRILIGTGLRHHVLSLLADSAEYRRTTETDIRIITTWFGLLRRAPTDAEVASVSSLGQPALINQLRGSVAYASRFTG